MPDLISDVEIQNNVHDIASFVNNWSLLDSETITCLKFIWVLAINYAFPVQIEGNRTRKPKYLCLPTYFLSR